jgi:4-amino-4-deoxy-L-arabinose transferase-like glycosyltransferase
MATLPVFYLLVKEKMGTSTALFSVFILAINPFHIRYSVLTMTEVPFIFFSMCALLFLFRFIKFGNFSSLLLSSLFLSCGNMIRFEGSIISVLFSLYLLYYYRGLGSFILYFFKNYFSTILVYMIISYTINGHLIHGLVMSAISEVTVRLLNH